MDLQSSQDFIRALKAQSDPPSQGLPVKIEIARRVWSNAALYVPSKGEVIAEWILTKFLKERTREPDSNPLLDDRYWSLLVDIVSPTECQSLARPSKKWLVPLLARIPVGPTVASFFDLLSVLEQDRREHLTSIVYRCLVVIWSLGVPKINHDALSECFGTVLRAVDLCGEDESLARIGCLITSSFRTFQVNTSNPKKVLGIFLENHLQTWMICASARGHSSEINRTLLGHIDMVGIEALFCLDNLRRNREPSFFNPLFDKLEELTLTSPTLSLGVLPHIFSSYIQRLKLHLSALYAQGSNRGIMPVEALLSDGMFFFTMCNNLVDKAAFAVEALPAKLALLFVVEKEGLFNAIQRDAEQSLVQVGQLAIDALNVEPFDRTGLVIEILSTLTRIDYDILGKVVHQILPKLLFGVEASSSAISYLNILVDYHAKTRTVPVYIHHLLTVLSLPPQIDNRNIYQVVSSGPLLHASHLERLGKSIQATLTPSQVAEVAQIVTRSLLDTWNRLPSCYSHRSEDDITGKQCQVETHTDPNGDPDDASAISFALSIKVACVILPLLPVQSVVKAVEQDIQRIVNDVQTNFIHLPLKNLLKIVQQRRPKDGWDAQIVTASILKFWHTLDLTRFLISQQFDPEILARLLETSKNFEILPELSLEIFRVLLRHCGPQYTDYSGRVLANLLDYLEHNLNELHDSCLDNPYHLDESKKRRGAATLFRLVIQRWLPVIDAIASRQHLKRFVRLLLGILQGDLQVLSVGHMRRKALAEAFCSAQFWELHNLRSVLLSCLDNDTSILDQIDARSCLARRSCEVPDRVLSLQQLQDTVLLFGTIMLIPIEYLAKACRTNLVRRALAADVFLSLLPSGGQSTETFILRSSTILRVFLQRALTHTGFNYDHIMKPVQSSSQFSPSSQLTMPSVSELLEHMLNERKGLTQPTVEYRSATLNLIEGCFSMLLNDKTNIQELLSVLTSFTKLDSPTPFSKGRLQATCIRQSGLLRFIELTTSSFSRHDFPTDILTSITALQNHFYTSVCSQMTDLTAQEFAPVLFQQGDLLNVWCHVLSFGNWLQLDTPVDHRFGRYLVTKFLNVDQAAFSDSQSFADMNAAVLGVLLEELHTYSETERQLQLDVMVAAYVALYRLSGTKGGTQMDALFARAGKQFAVADFSHTFELILESLSNPSNLTIDLENLTRLMSLLLHDAPEGTLKTIQMIVSKGLNAFANCEIFIRGPPSLRLQVLDFIVKVTSDRPAALQLINLGSIWSLLSRYLVGSPEHDDETSAKVFHDIVAIVNALIRLRRDLVVSTLPQVAMILRQLVMSMRHLRPQLGTKQSRLVAETLPRWINPAYPLTADEGKALARLLAILTIKGVVKSHAHFTETQKAESLAKPFSKHASFVLNAYIEIMNDPLCVVPLEIRKALQPGLFSLCDMLNEHTRDALMVSISSADGKAVMKSLWKEYERQRYIGKG